MTRLLALIVLMVTLASCQVFGGGGGGGDGSVNTDPESPIQWDRSPETVVFRAEVVGGEYADAFFSRNDVPYCTIYGDNRIVWTVPSVLGDTETRIDRLTDVQIRTFISSLTVEERIYTYDSEADLQLPAETSPVVEMITVFVNGVEHKTDAFSNWPPNYFDDVLERCRAISQAPVEYLPEAGWVSAQVVEYDSGVPSVPWNAQASGLSLKGLAESGERRWLTDRNLKILWQLIHTSTLDMQFSEEGEQYQVAVEVPNVNPSAPPAP